MEGRLRGGMQFRRRMIGMSWALEARVLRILKFPISSNVIESAQMVTTEIRDQSIN